MQFAYGLAQPRLRNGELALGLGKFFNALLGAPLGFGKLALGLGELFDALLGAPLGLGKLALGLGQFTNNRGQLENLIREHQPAQFFTP
ncbi:MAG: hypothetical protein RMK99_04530, partial [Anaerolineales bacterium]|nr:hypothetical protein [Anaerolineales bacterium]